MKQKDNKKDYSLTGNVNDNVNDNVNVNVNSLCSYRNSAISLQTSAIINQLTLSLTLTLSLSLTFQPWLAGSFYSTFISTRPIIIQMISLTRQMMLTNNPVAAESPNAVMESMKPPS